MPDIRYVLNPLWCLNHPEHHRNEVFRVFPCVPWAEFSFSMDGTIRSHIKPGQRVNIVLKKDQRSGKLTEGVVKDLLTKAPRHTRGIKVRLESGDIGRVHEILT